MSAGLARHAQELGALSATAGTARIAAAAKSTLREIAAERAARITEYRANLEAFDFGFEYSDDARVVREARRAFNHLREDQIDLDPDCAIWNSVCPVAYQRPVATEAQNEGADSIWGLA